ncbi:hypothetical protein ACFP51_08765 [Streptomyces pratens]|uniref:DUF742 domain-containing protein n=1 Tax=Streptomyces pratens TaxID=887456 RepID=A0ABW1LSW8_9ACTN
MGLLSDKVPESLTRGRRLRDSGRARRGRQGGGGQHDQDFRRRDTAGPHILAWLREPGRAEHGATAEAVAGRFGTTHPAALTRLRLLTAVGLLCTGGAAVRPHYRCDEVRIAEVARMLEKGWQRIGPTAYTSVGSRGRGR